MHSNALPETAIHILREEIAASCQEAHSDHQRKYIFTETCNCKAFKAGRFGQSHRRMLQRTQSNGSQASTQPDRKDKQKAAQKKALEDLAASYGLSAVPPLAMQESPVHVASSEEEPIQPRQIVPGRSSKSPLGNEKVKQYECFDINLACWVRHVKGQVVRAKMSPGPNGFMMGLQEGEIQATREDVLHWLDDYQRQNPSN